MINFQLESQLTQCNQMSLSIW